MHQTTSSAHEHKLEHEAVIPQLPENATPDQKEEHWLRHVYQGDRMPQLTVRAVLMGGFLGMALSASNLYTTLSIGWAFGIAITSCVLSFVIWNFVMFCSGGRWSQMSLLENACMASTASAAGYSTGSTIATMFGAMVLLHDIPPGQTAADVKTWDVTVPWVVTMFTLSTGLMGVFLAIPMKRQMINVEQLPFPSGTAAAETLRSLYSASIEAIRKAYVLVWGIVVGLVVGFLRAPDDVVANVGFLKRFFDWIKFRIPGDFHMTFLNRLYPRNMWPQGFAFEPSFLLIAAGMIVGLRISISLLVSSVVLYAVVGPWLAGMDEANRHIEGYKLNLLWTDAFVLPWRWSLWGGTSIMVFASLTSVALQWKTVARAFTGIRGGASSEKDTASKLAEIEVPGSWMIIGMLPITLAMVWLQIQAFGVTWYAGIIAVAMSFVLAMVASRATGETDTTPIGAMGKVMQLLFAALAPKNVAANLASAGIAANSASSSSDLLTDLKTGYLLGANPRKQFLAQFFGVFFGTVAIIPIWYLMVPTRAKLETFALPSTRAWEAVARVLTKGIGELPSTAVWAIMIGAAVGIALPLVERLLPSSYRRFMPSVTGIGLAWVMPFQNAFSFFLGAVIAALWTKMHRKTADSYNISLASGLIAGESLVLAGLAITATVVGLIWGPQIAA
ncbi:MAG: OPT/YSL family transporter [Phycisphaerales bacterium]|nr:OPT/YSL family transporter [Phycisphaerales bacterium]